MSTTIPEADLIIVWGPRSVLSLVGIVVLVAGVWYTDRAWDEKGSAAYNRAKTRLLQEKKNSAEQEVTIPPKELDEAFPFPIAFLVGWVLFGLAYFFPVDGSTTFSVNKVSVPPFVVSVALSIIASVPMGHAVRYRNAQRKTVLGMLFVASWVLLTALSGSEFGVLAYILRAIGAASIVASMKILWKHRKMGDWWEQEGRPNPNPVVYNIGGPLFVMGWFLFWVGMAATKPNGIPNDHYLPIYLTVRSMLAFVAGCGMVPVVLFLDYAHDEGAEFTGFGTDGRYFGWFEKPWAFLISWTLFGFASWLPLDSNGVSGVTILQWVILINCSLQGFVAGVLIQTALYNGDMAGKNKFSIPFVLLFIALAVEIGFNANVGALGWLLSVPGAMLIIAGQKTVFGDRKRGDYWMQNNQTVNPNPVVYSPGEPLFMTGWILMFLAMSIPN